MKEICRQEKCCGCAACVSVCPHKAIEMYVDKHGFKRPKINQEKCVDCQLCQRACPVGGKGQFRKTKKAYAIKAKDNHIRQESQSGGAFSVIAQDLIKQGWIIYGASFAGIDVVYERVTGLSDLNRLKKSKYVQADMTGIHRDIERDLRKGNRVLFSGTPCYVASVISFLQAKHIDCKRLVTIDVICYGVPSPRLYEEYIKLEEQKSGKKVLHFTFRDKEWSLNEKYSRIVWENSSIETLTNGYLRMFSNKLAVRPSCISCDYARAERVSDITIGDYWGIEKLKPEFDDNRGVSVLICHTEKGKEIFHGVYDKFESHETEFESAQKKQPALTKPSGSIKGQNEFWDDYEKHGLQYVLSQYCDYDTSCHINIKGKRILTKDKNFLYSHFRGILKTRMPNQLRPFIRKILRR